MEITLKEHEKLLYTLRELYRQYGYHSFRMSKFEKYELYARNKDFLVSDRVITFNDMNGDLLALKPDVTLSIAEREIGGLGIFMVKKSMDDMDYEYQNGQNILTIRKRIG
jgi:ATP phosphoribosyltransferase regulatory subunit HisZ